MTNSKETFEVYLREKWQLRSDPFLRPCNDIIPDRTYQDFDTDSEWETWQASHSHIIALLQSDKMVEVVAETMANGWEYGTHPKDKAKAAIAAILKE